MTNKQAFSIQMNSNVSDSERELAESAKKDLEKLIFDMKKFSEYFDIIYLPFKKYQNPDMEMITEYRRTFIQYKNEIARRFENLNKMVYKVIGVLNNFSSDTAITEIIESFVSAVKDLEKYIDTFLSIFSNFNDNNFGTFIVSTIDSINKQINQIEQIINDRVIDYIDTNILAVNWTDDLDEEKIPLVIRLFQERQKMLENQ